MPQNNRTGIVCDYERGAAVLRGVGTEKKDPLGCATVISEVSREAFKEHGQWRVDLSTPSLLTRLRKAWPLCTITDELVKRVEIYEKAELQRAKAMEYALMPIEQQEALMKKAGLSLKHPPMGAHQTTSIGFALLLMCCALFPDTGLGKTYIGIGVAQVLHDRKQRLAPGSKFRVLVLGPKTLLRTGWGEDVDKFSTLGWEDIGNPRAADRDSKCPFCDFVAPGGGHVSLPHLKKHLQPVAENRAPPNHEWEQRRKAVDLQLKTVTDDEQKKELRLQMKALLDERKKAVDVQMKLLLEQVYREHPRLQAAGKEDRLSSISWLINNSPASIFLINPENFHGDTADAIKLVPWDMVIVDESTMMRNSESRITKELLAFGDRVARKIIMTATPRPNTSLEFWGQMAFVDYCLGANFKVFKEKYFEEDRQGYRCWARPGADLMISDIVSKRSLRFRQRDCLDLPDETHETIEVPMGPEQKKSYAEMIEDMSTTVYEEVDGKKVAVEVSVNMKIAQMMKLAQIGSGFIYSRDREEPVILEDNPRIDETVRLCEQFVLNEDRQVVVWVRFSHTEGNIIKKRLNALGIKTSNVWGEMTSKELEVNIADFKSGKSRVMLANARSAQFGHTWVMANAMIFHSYDYSWESYYQCKKRIMRYGQTKNCTYINIVTRGSIDKQIMRALQEKGDASAIVVDREFLQNVRNQFEEA